MIRTLILLTLMIALYGAPAAAQGKCGSYQGMANLFEQSYGEVFRKRWTDGNATFEFWASEANGTWSIIAIFPRQGWACFLKAGGGWKPTPEDTPA